MAAKKKAMEEKAQKDVLISKESVPSSRAKNIPEEAKKTIKEDFGIFIADSSTNTITVVGKWASPTPNERTKGDSIPFSMATEEAAGKALEYYSQIKNAGSQVRFWKHVLRAAQGGLFKGLGGSK